ncbi:hypothetical protein, partial [Pseudomonas syringae]|uniref:hypothetical protein n=1 Tax=Pseudomonas syringae TaxID=317 RepID=UPI001F208F50
LRRMFLSFIVAADSTVYCSALWHSSAASDLYKRQEGNRIVKPMNFAAGMPSQPACEGILINVAVEQTGSA